jgi:Fe-S cluster assembly protein SufB
MTGTVEELGALVDGEYRYGFVTDLDADIVPVGLDESVVRLIASKHDEPDWLVEWRLGALRHFLTLEPPMTSPQQPEWRGRDRDAKGANT